MSSLMELLKNKKQALSANRRAKTVKPEDGRSRWRILPSWRKADADNADQFWHDFGAHYIKDQAGDLKAVYICAEKTFNKPCAICSAVSHAVKNTHDDEMVKLLKESACKSPRILMNALRVDGENPTEPVILEVPAGVFEGIMNIVMEWGPETLDLAAGKDFVIERAGKGINTKYSVQIAAKSAPVDGSVLKKLHNLDEYVAQESEEQAARALANFRQVAGLLPAGGVATAAAAALPSAKPAMSSMMIDDDDAALAALEAGTDVPAAAVSAKPAAAAPAAAASSDNELDDLLASLG